MKKLSIIIPIFNTEKYLKECINSIIISKKEFEVLLIDDGSTDSSGKICDNYSKIDSRIKVIHKKNGGVSSARNVGLNYATGEYIMFVDSDDVLSNDWDCLFEYINDNDINYFDSRIDKNISKKEVVKYIIGNNDRRIYISAPFRKVIKKDLILKNKIMFDENIINGEDMLFNLEILLSSKSFEVINFDYYYYRQAIGQSTRKFNKKIINSDLKFHKRLDSILNKYKIDVDFKNELEFFCLNSAIILILNRISYIDKYKNAKEYFCCFEELPYSQIINTNRNNNKNKKIYQLLKSRKYRLLYLYLKIKNKLSVKVRKIKKEELSII